MSQASLFDAPTLPPDTPAKRAGDGVRQSFEAFHAENPHVLTTLRDEALRVKAKGWKVFGMKALVEGLRWDARLATNGKPWKLNNSHVASYARLLMETTPDLRGFFRLR